MYLVVSLLLFSWSTKKIEVHLKGVTWSGRLGSTSEVQAIQEIPSRCPFYRSNQVPFNFKSEFVGDEYLTISTVSFSFCWCIQGNLFSVMTFIFCSFSNEFLLGGTSEVVPLKSSVKGPLIIEWSYLMRYTDKYNYKHKLTFWRRDLSLL